MIILPETPLDKSAFSQRSYDICIVGAGPAGIICALELARINPDLKICLLESGAFRQDEINQDLNQGENRSKILNDLEDPGISRIRGLGGTTNAWGGYLSPFDEETFKAKAWIPNSGWPIELADLQPYYDKAAEYFYISSNFSLEHYIETGFAPVDFPEKPLTQKTWKMLISDLGVTHKPKLEASENIHVYLGTTCVSLEANAADVVTAVVCHRSEGRCRFSAATHVVAMGGLENARFLLNQSKISSNLMPETRRNVGRYFSLHPHFWFGSLMLTGKILDHKVYFGSKHGAAYYRTLLRVPEAVRADNQWHDACFEFGGPSPPEKARTEHALQRLTPERHKLFAFLVMTNEMPALPENHVGLTDKLDRYGQNQLYLDMRLDQQTLDSSIGQYQYLAEALGANGYGRVKANEQYFKDIKDGEGRSQFWGGHHHMCTTRMSVSSEDGVVDKNCRVHDCENLYLLGSSSFSSCGIANPTYTIGALAARLADHINASLNT